MRSIATAFARACLVLSLAATLAGCSVRVTGADTVQDFAAEDQYRAAYQHGVSAFEADAQAFAATATNPGVCNKGGSMQGCYDADTAVIADFKQFLTLLATVPVPPRFVAADQLLRAAIAKDISALEMRNEAIANNDNALWTAHKPILEQAVTELHAAYLAFPEDNRPIPAL